MHMHYRISIICQTTILYSYIIWNNGILRDLYTVYKRYIYK